MYSRVAAATEEAQVPVSALPQGTASKFELDDRSCLSCLSWLEHALRVNMKVVQMIELGR